MTFRFGRKRPNPHARRLAFADYAIALPPPPPTSLHWAHEAEAWAELENVYGNDTLGDCTAAGAAHAEVIWRGAAKNKDRLPTTADVIKFYSETTGYVPGDPKTDQGGDEITVLNHWKNKGFFADGSGKIEAWVTADGANETQVKQAIWLGESLYFGVELPDPWVRPFPAHNGFVWDVAGPPNPDNGHAFVAIGYNSLGVIIDTWGMFGTVTWAAVKAYATTRGQGEIYCMFSQDAINRAIAKAANGFDFPTLLADSVSL